MAFCSDNGLYLDSLLSEKTPSWGKVKSLNEEQTTNLKLPFLM